MTKSFSNVLLSKTHHSFLDSERCKNYWKRKVTLQKQSFPLSLFYRNSLSLFLLSLWNRNTLFFLYTHFLLSFTLYFTHTHTHILLVPVLDTPTLTIFLSPSSLLHTNSIFLHSLTLSLSLSLSYTYTHNLWDKKMSNLVPRNQLLY